MNAPTPAQALGEVMALHKQAMDAPDGLDCLAFFKQFDTAAGRFLLEHGQHFAWLEQRAENCERLLATRCNEYNAVATDLFKMRQRAEAAEARCAELKEVAALHKEAWQMCNEAAKEFKARAEAAEKRFDAIEETWREAFVGTAEIAFRNSGMNIEQAHIHANAQADCIAAFLAANGGV